MVTRNNPYLDEAGYSELEDGSIQFTPARLTLTERYPIDPQRVEVITVIKGNVDLLSDHLRLPNLRKIEGNLLVRNKASVDFPQLKKVSSSLSLYSDANARIALPELKEVGASVAVGHGVGPLDKIAWIGGDLKINPQRGAYEKVRMPELIVLAGGVVLNNEVPPVGVVLDAPKLRVTSWTHFHKLSEHLKTGQIEIIDKVPNAVLWAKLRERLTYWQRHDHLMEDELRNALISLSGVADEAPEAMAMGL